MEQRPETDNSQCVSSIDNGPNVELHRFDLFVFGHSLLYQLYRGFFKHRPIPGSVYVLFWYSATEYILTCFFIPRSGSSICGRINRPGRRSQHAPPRTGICRYQNDGFSTPFQPLRNNTKYRRYLCWTLLTSLLSTVSSPLIVSPPPSPNLC